MGTKSFDTAADCGAAGHVARDCKVTLKKAASVMAEAGNLINGPRQKEYGHPNENFQRIADTWTHLLSKKLKPGAEITRRDVAILMCGLKLMREVGGPKRDTLVDLVAYGGLAEEVS